MSDPTPSDRADATSTDELLATSDLSFYDHGGEFAIHLIRLRAGSGLLDGHYLTPVLRVFSDAAGDLRAFMDVWDVIAAAAKRRGVLTKSMRLARRLKGGRDER